MFKRKPIYVHVPTPDFDAIHDAVIKAENELLRSLERRMWQRGNELRQHAKNTQESSDWTRYDGLEQAKAIVLKEMARRNVRPK